MKKLLDGTVSIFEQTTNQFKVVVHAEKVITAVDAEEAKFLFLREVEEESQQDFIRFIDENTSIIPIVKEEKLCGT